MGMPGEDRSPRGTRSEPVQQGGELLGPSDFSGWVGVVKGEGLGWFAQNHVIVKSSVIFFVITPK